MPQETAEFAYDLHAGLSTLQVPEFDQLQIIGMATTLAVNIKGLGDIEYEVEQEKGLSLMLSANKRARQFIMAASEYMIVASGLPKDLDNRIQNEFGEL